MAHRECQEGDEPRVEGDDAFVANESVVPWYERLEREEEVTLPHEPSTVVRLSAAVTESVREAEESRPADFASEEEAIAATLHGGKSTRRRRGDRETSMTPRNSSHMKKALSMKKKYRKQGKMREVSQHKSNRTLKHTAQAAKCATAAKKLLETQRRRRGTLRKQRGVEKEWDEEDLGSSRSYREALLFSKQKSDEPGKRTPQVPLARVSVVASNESTWTSEAWSANEFDELMVVEFAGSASFYETEVDRAVSAGLANVSPSQGSRWLWLDVSRNAYAYRLPECVVRSTSTKHVPTLANLTGLNLSGCRFSSPGEPSSLGVIGVALADTLRYLDASKLDLHSIPSSWGSLRMLRVLDVSDNVLHDWPAADAESALARKTYFAATRFAPSGLASSLRRLNLAHNGLADVPERVALLVNLEHLDVAYNNLAVVDDALFEACTKLRYLDLSNNNLVELGRGVATFANTSGAVLKLQHNDQLLIPPAYLADHPFDLLDFYDSLDAADSALQMQRHRAFLALRDKELLRRMAVIEARAKRRNELGSISNSSDSHHHGHDEAWDGQRIAQLVLRLKHQGALKQLHAPSPRKQLPPLPFDHHLKPPSQGISLTASETRLTLSATPGKPRRVSDPSAPGNFRASSGALPRTKSESAVVSPLNGEERRRLLMQRAADAEDDLAGLRAALEKLGRGDDYVEVLACFCCPTKVPNDASPNSIVVPSATQLELMREIRALIDVLPLPLRELVPAARWPTDVLLKLQNVKPRVLHFAGHCMRHAAGGSLVFSSATQDGLASLPSFDDFVHVLEACDGLELCFLNACKSADLGRSLVKRLPHISVVCWESSVADRPASALAEHFYRYLATRPGCAVEDAFNAATSAWLRQFQIGDPCTAATREQTCATAQQSTQRHRDGRPNLVSVNNPYNYVNQLTVRATTRRCVHAHGRS